MDNTTKTLGTKIAERKHKLIGRLMTAMISVISMLALAMPAFATSDSGGDASTAGTEQFNSVIGFFATWIGRIGLIVGFVGAIMFALAIKNDDADAKTRGLMTLASGFVVYAVTMALDMFKII